MRCDLPKDLTDAAGWQPRQYNAPQIRSYVLDQNRVKDLRTGIECAPDRVLNGDLDEFIRAALLLDAVR